MSYSLALVNGDLAKGAGKALATVTDEYKVAQDLFCWLYHPFGADPMNPGYGSFIDSAGGISVNIEGKTFFLPKNYAELVKSEVNRILNAYITNQRNKINFQAQVYGGNIRVSPNEIVSGYTVDSQIVDQTLYISINLNFSGGNQATLQIPLNNKSGL
jgi:hypothetical protein